MQWNGSTNSNDKLSYTKKIKSSNNWARPHGAVSYDLKDNVFIIKGSKCQIKIKSLVVKNISQEYIGVYPLY